MRRFRNLTLWSFSSLLLVFTPVISGLSDKEVDICRDLGFIVNSGLTTIKFHELTGKINTTCWLVGVILGVNVFTESTVYMT